MKTVLAIACLLGLPLFAVGQNVVQIEYFLDTDAGFGKNTLMTLTPAADGPFSLTLNASAVSAGYHILYMRIRDSNGQWSHTNMRNVEVFKNQSTISVARVEYLFDSDPGVGKAAAIALATPQPDGTITFVIPKDKTTPGAHILYVRAQDSPDRNWSLTQWKALTVVNCIPPDQPAAVSSQTICAGSPATFTIPAVASATGYRWALPTNWTIASGQGTGTVTVRTPAVTSVTTFTTLSVAAYSTCDTGQVRLFSATVNPLPVRPTITTGGDTALVSGSASGNQWFLNGTPISGATGQTYRPLAAGQYTLQVTQNGCVSALSEAYNRVVTATDEPTVFGVQVYPNPITTFLTVVNADRYPAQIQLYSMTGQLLLTSEHIVGTRQLDMERFASGCYILRISQDNKTRTQVVLKH